MPGRTALRRAAPLALASLVVAAATAGEVAAAHRARAEATSRDTLTGGREAVVVVGGQDDRRGDALLFWNRRMRLASLDGRRTVPETGVVEPPLPVAEVYIDLTGLGPFTGSPPRVAETLEGVYDDGWTGERAIYRRFAPLRRDRLALTLSRTAWTGPPVPGRVTVEVVGGAARALNVGGGQKKRLELPVPAPPFEVVVRSQTFSPADFGGSSDTRRLGVRLTIGAG